MPGSEMLCVENTRMRGVNPAAESPVPDTSDYFIFLRKSLR
jgi:hypothetical protein